MKVDTAFKLPPTPPARNPAKQPIADSATGEQVKLSEAAQVKGSEAPVNSSRIQEIKQAISEGRFRINPEAIAERLLTSAQELIDTQRRA